MGKAVNEQANGRFERKFFVEGLNRYEIETLVEMHPAIFSKAFPQRYVNNIYFDSIHLKSYFDNVHGVKNRLKIRIRWYGELFGHIQSPVLELKIKDGLMGWKDSYPLLPFSFDSNFSIEVLSKVFQESDIPDQLKFELMSLSPTLLNGYNRKYYLSIDGDFRITIDFDRAFYQIGPYNNSFCKKVYDDISIILELKYAYDQDQFADKISNAFPFRMTKSSKYVSGLDYLNS